MRINFAGWLLLVVSTTLLTCNLAFAEDWPMWRRDSARSAQTPEKLPEQLHLQWTRALPSARPAWPNEPRLHFDASYEPIVSGKRIFVGSPNDGSMTAYDAETGCELWMFYTDGPVRMAAVAWKGSVIFGSDDGHLYCVDEVDGSLKWRVRGVPDKRRDHRHLGNGRLISFWPVRGGPVLADGVVYFGAGVWPTMGVFIRAVDASSGKVLWTNANSSAIENVRIDHNKLDESGLAPQGHLLVAGDMLIVPNGRSMPARFDRKTGKLKYFVQGYRNGDSRVILSGNVALVGLSGVVRLKDGREVASRWESAGKDKPEGWSANKDLFEGPMFPYKFQPGSDYRSVIDDGICYGMQAGVLYAYDHNRANSSLYDLEDHGRRLRPRRWDAPLLWKFDVGQAASLAKAPHDYRTLIKAGNRIYGHIGKTLLAVSVPNKTGELPTLAWSKTLNAEPMTMLAADGKLILADTEGTIHCFGGARVEPKNYEQRKMLDQKQNQPPLVLNRAMKEVSNKRGVAIVAGLRNGLLVQALLDHTDMKVIAMDEDADVVHQLRRRLAAHPKQENFQAIVGTPNTVELPPYVASLVLSEAPGELNLIDAPSIARLLRSLRPYGGTICFDPDRTDHQAIEKAVGKTKLSGFHIDADTDWVLIKREGQLPGAADWTHETADAARSFFSRDELVKAPLAVLWYGDGYDHGFNKRKDYGHGVKPQVAGGRLFALQVATNSLHAVDAYTGQMLWKRKFGASARYASFPETIYVADGRNCEVLNATDGRSKKVFRIDVGKPGEQAVSATDIRVAGGIILIGIRFNKENKIDKGRWNSQLLVALDRQTGRQLWSRHAAHRYNTSAVAVAGSRVFCIDSHSPAEISAMRQRGESLDRLPSSILALDARTGKVDWSVVKKDPPADLGSLFFMSLRTQDDWLAYSAEHNLLLAGKAKNTYAFNADNGKQVWHKPIRGQQPLILGAGRFINQTGHTYEIATGKILDGGSLFRRGGCNYAVGNRNLLFLRSNCAAYVDIASRWQYNLRNLRSGCSNSLIAADGILNAPCFSMGCVCNYPIQTSFSMFHLPAAKEWHGTAVHQAVPVDVEKKEK